MKSQVALPKTRPAHFMIESNHSAALRVLHAKCQRNGDAQGHVVACLELIQFNARSRFERLGPTPGALYGHRLGCCVHRSYLPSDFLRFRHDHTRTLPFTLWRDRNSSAFAGIARRARLANCERNRFRQRGLDRIAHSDLVKLWAAFTEFIMSPLACFVDECHGAIRRINRCHLPGFGYCVQLDWVRSAIECGPSLCVSD